MTTFTNSKLTDEYVSNATLIRLILWADQHNSHYVVAALRELQERRKADSVPVEINDDMVYAFHHALSDSSLGADEVEEIKAGLRAAFANVTAQPVPVVPDDWQLVPKKITLEMECALSKADSYEIGWLWALAAAPKYEVQNAKRVQNALNTCRAAMLQSQGEGNPHVTPARLPGGFTIEDTKELHEDLVRSHISQALSGEKMKKKDRDADLRWIHGVIVQAAWFVKASLEQTALSGTPPVTTDGWISCSERMPEKNQNVLISVNFDSSLVEPLICSARYTGSTFRRGDATIKPGNDIEQATHWMLLPEPPKEVNQ